MEENYPYTNALIHETSPYLLQHAHNPVDWLPWGEAAWQKAREEDKLVIISIGYSACHWCHVMERESFEDVGVAKWMNQHYVCIKVDREERPDVDQFFMDAANLMHGRGGWPLNAFALPDGRPVYAGTYFPKNQWMGLLHELAGGYRKNKQKYIDYAEKLTQGITSLNIIRPPEEEVSFSKELLRECYFSFAQQFDRTYGGKGRAPKFPMPDNYLFLLRYQHLNSDKEALAQVYLTLDKMAMGGIYDQTGGGFARYSTDAQWKVPHFEKMLYDNAQLLSLYSEAYQKSKNPLYKKVVYQTIAFLRREMLHPEGGFYSALDADSEGEEGKYYVWTEKELEEVLPAEDLPLLKAYFGVGKEGWWEEDKNILVVAKTSEGVAQEYGISAAEAKKKIAAAEKILLTIRSKRLKPGLDDKILFSWNMLMIKGLLDAYKVFQEAEFLSLAENCLDFIRKNMVSGLKLRHSWKDGKAPIQGFLDDYAFYIQTLIHFYELNFQHELLDEALRFAEYVSQNFSSEDQRMYYFTSQENTEVVARKIETSDNVIASPNSVMGHNLYKLALLYDKPLYLERAQKMLEAVVPQLLEYGPFYSNWAILLTYFIGPYYEVAIAGSNALKGRLELESLYIPNKVVLGTTSALTALPLLEHKYVEGQTLFYVCENKLCHRPATSAQEALELVQHIS